MLLESLPLWKQSSLEFINNIELNQVFDVIKGFGLGLNRAQNLAQLMGGEITCTSSVGLGSKFEILVYLSRQ